MDAIPRRCPDCGERLDVIFRNKRKARKHLAHYSCPNKANHPADDTAKATDGDERP